MLRKSKKLAFSCNLTQAYDKHSGEINIYDQGVEHLDRQAKEIEHLLKNYVRLDKSLFFIYMYVQNIIYIEKKTLRH